MRRFKINNRQKRKYTKKTTTPVVTKSINTKRSPYILISITALISIIIIQYYAIKFISELDINIAIPNITLEINSIFIQISTLIYSNLLFQINIINQIILTIQSLTNLSDKILYKTIFTIIYTINLTNTWIITHQVFLLQAIGYTITLRWEKFIKIISDKLTISGQELGALSPSINFILHTLSNTAQGLFNNIHNMLKSLYTKNLVDV